MEGLSFDQVSKKGLLSEPCRSSCTSGLSLFTQSIHDEAGYPYKA